MLTNKEMLDIDGGSLNWGLLTFIGGALTLLAGIVDGFMRPLKCR